MELLLCAGLLFSLFQCADSQFRRGGGLIVRDPEPEWDRMQAVISEEAMHGYAAEPRLWKSTSKSGTLAVAKQVPQYMVISSSQIRKSDFEPDKGARPLPDQIRETLLQATATPAAPTTPRATRSPLVEMLCHIDRMYVRIRRTVFKTREAYKYLKLGTCPVNQGTKIHYYHLYLLTSDCGFKIESNVDFITIGNVLSYKPPGPVIRELSFDIPLQCKYPRFFYSFKVGYSPKLQGGTVHKVLQKCGFTLTPQDASGNEISSSKTYILGQAMYFEAKQSESAASSGNQRIYINKCYITASQDPKSNPKYTVIDNQGCMTDSKVTDQSKFLPGTSKLAQRFQVAALIFDNMDSSSPVKKLYIHCEISIGKFAPTESSKACNYDTVTKKWKELYQNDSVCKCCDSTCHATQSKIARSMISSDAWNINLSSNEGYAVVDTLKSPTFSWEDPSMAEDDYDDYGGGDDDHQSVTWR